MRFSGYYHSALGTPTAIFRPFEWVLRRVICAIRRHDYHSTLTWKRGCMRCGHMRLEDWA